MRYLRLKVAYDGAAYAGWQIQPSDPTVQQLLQNAWREVTGESIAIVASGRTDSGVHALGQVCSAATESELPGDILLKALNANLPPDIRVLKIDDAPLGFHAIRDATGKTYRYQIQFGQLANVFLRNHYWHIRKGLDVGRMREAAGELVGEHDFAAFQAVGAERVSSVRIVHRIELIERQVDGFDELFIVISANGFLYNMVRIIAGSLVLVGRHKQPVGWLTTVLESRDRRTAGPTAPAHGLVLVQVDYAF